MSSPRDAMSVATITSYLPLLNPSSASIRSRCVRFECSTATACWACLSRCATRSAFCFVRQKNQHAVEICSLQQRHEKIEFLFCCHGINCKCDCLRWRAAGANLHQRGITQHPCRQTFDFRWQRGREKQTLPISRDFFNDTADVRQKTHVQHPVHFIEHKNFHRLQGQRALFEQIEQPSRRRH